MKILLATYWPMPHFGGVNTYVQSLKSQLEGHGHQVDILSHHPDMEQIYLQSSDPQTNGKAVKKAKLKDNLYYEITAFYERNLPHVEPWIRWRELERYVFELAAALFDLGRYDLIHTQDIISTRALRRVKPAHIPHVYTLQGLLANVHRINGDIATKQSLRWKYVSAEEYFGTISADLVIATSNWLKRELVQNFGVPKTMPMVTIPYGIDANAVWERMHLEPEPPVPIPENRFILACPARLSPEKGHKILIEGLSILKEQRQDFVCWIIGDGVLRRELEHVCEEKGVKDYILFLGNRSDVPALLNKADLVVVPSIEDNLPHSLMEAQIAGKAVVAARSGGIPEMIEHGKTGMLFENQNGHQLARCINQVLGDPQLRRQLESNARAFGEKQWSLDALAERTLAAYEMVRKAKKYSSRKEMGKKSPASIFRHEVNTVFFRKEWKEVLPFLPTAYTIPDPSFTNRLANT